MTRSDLRFESHPTGTVILIQDWFSRLFDGEGLKDVMEGLRALGYRPRLLTMRSRQAGSESRRSAEFRKDGLALRRSDGRGCRNRSALNRP